LSLYLDTSALVKVFLGETGADAVRRAIAADPVVWTCAIAYVETRASFARAQRDNRLSHTQGVQLRAEFESVWATYSDVTVDGGLLLQAGELLDRHTQHALRSLDALHLAAALQVAAGEPGAVTLVCFDRRLWRSARDEGFECLPRAQP
jgi:predicted nucleic acid-binding protein